MTVTVAGLRARSHCTSSHSPLPLSGELRSNCSCVITGCGEQEETAPFCCTPPAPATPRPTPVSRTLETQQKSTDPAIPQTEVRSVPQAARSSQLAALPPLKRPFGTPQQEPWSCFALLELSNVGPALTGYSELHSSAVRWVPLLVLFYGVALQSW